jgi:hypothetical protein
MILYRLASDAEKSAASLTTRDSQLLPPKITLNSRHSTLSESRSSVLSLDSKFGALSHRDSAFPNARGGLVPYEYDPALDELDPVDEEDMLHDPTAKGKFRQNTFPWRGILNVAVLAALISGLLALFVLYPVLVFYRDRARNLQIDGNIRINGTGILIFILSLHVSLTSVGQAPVLFQMPDLIDAETPADARSRTGFDGQDYELVFSDEFNVPGRSFYPGMLLPSNIVLKLIFDRR